MKKLFDIFIDKHSAPTDFAALKTLKELLGERTDISLPETLRKGGSGFLGVDLTREDAQKLQEMLQIHLGGGVEIRAIKYRDKAPIPFALAEGLAKKYLLKRKLEKEYVCEEWAELPVLFSEAGMNWHFALSSPSLVSKGFVPGLLIARVDKVDGHIWTEQEVRYYEYLNSENQILAYAAKSGKKIPALVEVRDDSFAETIHKIKN